MPQPGMAGDQQVAERGRRLNSSRESYERASDPSRVVAFSDGVFAIIITLLVLEIQVPELAGGQTLTEALEEIRPSLVAFLVSFVVVAIAWAGHRDLFSLMRRTDRAIVWLNFGYLLPLCILPFGASLIARFDSEAVALEMYGLLLVAVALTRLGTWWYATGRPHLLFVPMDMRSRFLGSSAIGVQGAAYAVAIALAATSPTVNLAIYGAVPILYFIAITLVRSAAPAGSAERDFT
jgi:TMEM175 potassium channel family protein